MADERIRIGMIGCGGNARGHMLRLAEVPDAEVVALTDPDPDSLSLAKKVLPGLADRPEYADHEDMIAAEALDAVVISTPHSTHYDQIVSSLRAGLHVLCEKPMVCTVEHARSVIEEEKKSGKVLAVSYQRHCEARCRFVKHMIESGRTGPVQFVSAFQGQNWLEATRGTWRQNKELSMGGQLNDSGSHLIDIILWMTGLRAESARAEVEKFDADVDINSAVTLRFTNGARGSIAVVGNCPFPGVQERIEIVCEKWVFFLDRESLRYSTGMPGETMTFEDATYGEQSPDHNFIGAIKGEKEVAASSTSALRTIELTEAIWESVEAG